MNGAPKQVENVACGSAPKPFSVPATRCGIAGEEVVHRLFRRQLRNWRQHAKRIRRQHDDIGWVRALAGFRRVRNEIQWIAGARVLCERPVRQIKLARNGGPSRRFPARVPKRWEGRKNLRLSRSRKVDHLGIAAAFKIKDALIAPAMLIIADQCTAGICGKRGFAGTG